MNIILALTGLFFVLGLWKPRSRFVTLSMFIFMWLVMGWNTGNPDYNSYIYRYDNMNTIADIFYMDFADKGFSLLIVVSKAMNLSYEQFRIYLALFSLFLIYSTIVKYSLYPALVTLFYMLSIYVIDITQIRNFLAVSIIFFAIRYLIREGISGKIIFTVFTLLASTLHSSSTFFLLFLLAPLNINLSVIVIIVVTVFTYKTIFKEYFSSLFGTRVLDDLYSSGISTFAFISIIIVQIVNYLYVNLYKRHYVRVTSIKWKRNIHPDDKPVRTGAKLKFKFNRDVEINNFSNAKLIPFISLILFLLIPFYHDNMTYARLFKYTAILNFIYVSNHNYSNMFNSKVLNTILLFLYVSFFFWYFVIFTNGYDHVIYPILINNSLFN